MGGDLNRRTWLRLAGSAGVLLAVFLVVVYAPLPLLAPTDDETEETVENPPGIVLHWHVSLNITIQGERRVVPARIGLGSGLWADHSLDAFGQPGAAPLHTHTARGRIHIESTVVRNYTLGEFFAIWGQPIEPERLLDFVAGPGEQVTMTVKGTEAPVDPGLILVDGMSIGLSTKTGGA